MSSTPAPVPGSASDAPLPSAADLPSEPGFSPPRAILKAITGSDDPNPPPGQQPQVTKARSSEEIVDEIRKAVADGTATTDPRYYQVVLKSAPASPPRNRRAVSRSTTAAATSPMGLYIRTPLGVAEDMATYIDVGDDGVGHPVEYDTRAAIRRGVWLGHKEVAPHELVLNPAKGVWIVLVNHVSPDEPFPAGRRLTRARARQWMLDNRRGVPDELQDPPPPSPTIEEQALIDALGRESKGMRAGLVAYMVGKYKAACEDVKFEVHRDRWISDKAVSNNCGRVNREAERLGLSLRYCYRSAMVFKEP